MGVLGKVDAARCEEDARGGHPTARRLRGLAARQERAALPNGSRAQLLASPLALRADHLGRLE